MSTNAAPRRPTKTRRRTPQRTRRNGQRTKQQLEAGKAADVQITDPPFSPIQGPVPLHERERLLPSGTVIHGDRESAIITVRPADGSPNLLVRLPAAFDFPSAGTCVTYTVQHIGYQVIVTLERQA